jgi:hypothetical protein
VSDTVPLTLALGSLLALSGLAALALGVYVLARGGRSRHGGMGGFSGRDVHAAAGLRIITGGSLTLILGSLVLWLHVSG